MTTEPPQSERHTNALDVSKSNVNWRRTFAGRFAIRCMVLIAAMYITLCTVMYFMQDSLLFMPQLAPAPTPDSRIDQAIIREWLDIGEGERVEAWLRLPASTGAANTPAGTAPQAALRFPLVVHFHGNGESIEVWDQLARAYLERGFAVLMPEYRGYGRSGGKPSQQAIVDDALAIIQRTLAREDIDASRVVLHGRSLGGGVAAQIAARLSASGQPPAGMILESTFTSVSSFAAGYGVPTFLVKHPFRTDRVLAGEFNGPVLILHGKDDEIIPPGHAERLFHIAQGNTQNQGVKTLSLQPGEHNDFPRDQQAYWQAIDALLVQVMAR